MRSRSRRLRANLIYLRRPALEFLPVLLGMVVIVLLGGLCFRGHVHDGRPLGFGDAVFATYCLIFMEHLLPFPEDDIVQQAFYVLLPPLGLVVILDGIVRFSYHILRRDESGPEWCYAMAKTMNDHVVLFGLGKLGLRILQQLLRLGQLVLVVERDPHCPHLVYARKHGVPVRIGTGREEGLLHELNIEKAKSLIMATDDDLANLKVAIDARKVKPSIRVVLRMFDQELAEKVKQSMGIHLAFSTWELAAPLFATASFDRSIVNSFYVGDQLMVVARLRVNPGSALIGRTVGAIRNECGVLTLDLHRGGESSFIPASETALAEGDETTIQTRAETLKVLHEMNLDSPQ